MSPPRDDERPLTAGDVPGAIIQGAPPARVHAEYSTPDRAAVLLPGQDIDLDAAKAWVRRQFAGMSVLLEHVVSRLDTFDRARALVAAEVRSDVVLDDTGHHFRQSHSAELARQLFSAMYVLGAQTLIVEDELARRADRLEGVFSVGGAVLRSVAFSGDAASAVRLLRHGSGGYPCNALLCTGSEASLGLSDGADLSGDTVTRVVASVTGVLTSVWDDESYVVLWSQSEVCGLTNPPLRTSR